MFVLETPMENGYENLKGNLHDQPPEEPRSQQTEGRPSQHIEERPKTLQIQKPPTQQTEENIR